MDEDEAKPLREKKFFPRFEAKLLDDSTHGGFEGYVAVFGNEDSYGDIIEPGAFKETIQDFIRNGFAPVSHEWGALPIATISEAFEDEKGLFMRCEFHSTQAAQDARTVVRERLARGKTVGLSIGYEVLEYVIVKPEDGSWRYKRRLIKLKLYEGSIVTVPANAEAGVTDAKSGTTLNDHFARVLAAHAGLLHRCGSLADLRGAKGRQISEANRALLADLVASGQKLLAAAEPPATVDPATVTALHLRMLALETERLAS